MHFTSASIFVAEIEEGETSLVSASWDLAAYDLH